jgi:hypothetical protein
MGFFGRLMGHKDEENEGASEQSVENRVEAAARRDAARDAAAFLESDLPYSEALENALMKQSMEEFFCDLVGREHPELTADQVRTFVVQLIDERE